MRQVLGVILLLVVGSAQAAAVYSYTGNNYDEFKHDPDYEGNYTTEMRVTGSFETSVALGANYFGDPIADGLITDFSFFDSRATLTYDDVMQNDYIHVLHFSIATDVNGDVEYWLIRLNNAGNVDPAEYSGQHLVVTRNLGLEEDSGRLGKCNPYFTDRCLLDDNDWGRVLENPGVWTSSITAVPVPAAVWLFGSALAGLGWMRRRKSA